MINSFANRIKKYLKSSNFPVRRAAERVFGTHTYAPRIPRFELEDLQLRCAKFMIENIEDNLGSFPELRTAFENIRDYYSKFESVYGFLEGRGGILTGIDDFIPIMESQLDSDDPTWRIVYCLFMGDSLNYDPKLVGFLTSEDERVKKTSYNALLKISNNSDIAYKILSDIKEQIGMSVHGKSGEIIRPLHKLIKPNVYFYNNDFK
jgi:hypothetical protein